MDNSNKQEFLPFKHSFKVVEPARLSLVVYNVGFQKCSPGIGWGPAVRDHFLIHYVVSGRGQFEQGGQRVELVAGDAFLVRPDQLVSYQADQYNPWEYYWVGFAGSTADLLLAHTGFAHSATLSLSNGTAFRQSLLDIYKARGSDYPSGVRMAGYLQAALGLLMESATVQGAESMDIYARQGAELIEQNYTSPITIDEVASQVGVSRSYLYRAFQQLFGQSPKEYLHQYRMQRACQLLGHTDLSVKAVATSVGFEDPLYFSRAFRSMEGLSPSQYRNSLG